MPTPKTPTTNVVDFAAAREANKLAKGDLGPALVELAKMADEGKIRNLFIAWTMQDGSIHYGHASLAEAAKEWGDDQLRLMGLIRLAERGFVDAIVIDNPE